MKCFNDSNSTRVLLFTLLLALLFPLNASTVRVAYAEPLESQAAETAGMAQRAAANDASAANTSSVFSLQEGVRVEIVTGALNVRRGPGLGYEILTTVTRGQFLQILGQSSECRWLLVEDEHGTQGWISGKFQYVRFDATCDEISANRPQASEAAGDAETEADAPEVDSSEDATVPEPTAMAEDADVSMEATPTDIPEEEEVAAAQPTPEPAEEVGRDPMLTVVVPRLNLRGGPGTGYAIVGSAAEGEAFALIGQVDGCSWVTANHPVLGTVWMSGGERFTEITGDCTSLAVAAAPPLPTPASTAVPVAPVPTPTPAPAAEAPSEQATADELPADQGCYLIQNQLGAELNVTITARDWDFSDNFMMQGQTERVYCLGPGRYAFTADAPPPWNSINFEISVKAGVHEYLPIRAAD